ncbi:hypothetical protein E2C01_079795 [Portunus trituberculatus]|uniref:Uncharacterized protein n=1 Tax=Portunus trituberculatus TaxID=210409 RepID=A0A5B7IU98_PORTR|nr:hypothetical protein [Portunus trituberculatus]
MSSSSSSTAFSSRRYVISRGTAWPGLHNPWPHRRAAPESPAVVRRRGDTEKKPMQYSPMAAAEDSPPPFASSKMPEGVAVARVQGGVGEQAVPLHRALTDALQRRLSAEGDEDTDVPRHTSPQEPHASALPPSPPPHPHRPPSSMRRTPDRSPRRSPTAHTPEEDRPPSPAAHTHTRSRAPLAFSIDRIMEPTPKRVKVTEVSGGDGGGSVGGGEAECDVMVVSVRRWR